MPDLERLMKLCDLFEVTLDELTGRTAEAKLGKVDALSPSAAVSQAKMIGYILLAVSLVGALLLVLIPLYHLLLVVAVPLLMCSVLCLLLPRRAGYWCLWTLWLSVEFVLVFGISLVTGARLFPGVALVLWAVIGVAAWYSFRDVTVPVNRRAGGLLGIGWLGYAGLTAGLFYWVYHYGFVDGFLVLLLYYTISAGMTALMAGLFTYTVCFLHSWIAKRKEKGC